MCSEPFHRDVLLHKQPNSSCDLQLGETKLLPLARKLAETPQSRVVPPTQRTYQVFGRQPAASAASAAAHTLPYRIHPRTTHAEAANTSRGISADPSRRAAGTCDASEAPSPPRPTTSSITSSLYAMLDSCASSPTHSPKRLPSTWTPPSKRKAADLRKTPDNPESTRRALFYDTTSKATSSAATKTSTAREVATRMPSSSPPSSSSFPLSQLPQSAAAAVVKPSAESSLCRAAANAVDVAAAACSFAALQIPDQQGEAAALVDLFGYSAAVSQVATMQFRTQHSSNASSRGSHCSH